MTQPPAAGPSAPLPDEGPVADGPATAQPSLQDDALQEAVLLPPRGLLTTTLVLLALTAALAIGWGPSVHAVTTPSLQLEFWPGDSRQLEELAALDDALLRVDARAPDPQRQQDETAIRQGWAAWLRREAELGALDVQHDYEARQLLGQTQERVRTLVLRDGADAWRGVVVRYGRAVRQATEQFVLSLPEGATWTSAPVATRAAVEAVAPGWAATAQHLSLQRFVQDNRLSAAAARLVEALAQQRLYSLGARLPNPPGLSSVQQALILRFRVEAYEGLGLERKLDLLGQLASSDPAYPSVFVRGVLLARDHDCEGATIAWQQALRMHQQPAQARANLRWCARQREMAP